MKNYLLQLNYRTYMFCRCFAQSIRNNDGFLPAFRMSFAWFTCFVVGDISRKNRKAFAKSKAEQAQ